MESIATIFGKMVILLEWGIALCFPVAAVAFVYLSVIKPIIDAFRKDNKKSSLNSK